MTRELVELQMITGVLTEDFEYLLSLLLRGGDVEVSLSKESPYVESESSGLESIAVNLDLHNWFKEFDKYE